MFYEAEFKLLQKTLEKCRLQVLRLRRQPPADLGIDRGLRKLLGAEEEYGRRLYEKSVSMVKPNSIYRVTDQFLCSYLFFLMPDVEPDTVVLIGPYLSVDLDEQEILELAEKHAVPPDLFRHLEHYYGTVPFLADDKPVLALLEAFGERIWGEGNFTVTDVNQELDSDSLPLWSGADRSRAENIWNMQAMEERYNYENELMRAVSQGLTQKAELMVSGLSRMSFEQRLADPVRNLKNYCIILNTLLRKAAEQGGVHPVHLDSVSSTFARRIELINSTAAGQRLVTEMFRSYCRLVNRHSTQHYSPPVQRAAVHIDANLAGDLSLKALAASQNINASYLSALFKRETGRTVTDYVNEKRVRQAQRLLRDTRLQVQTVAQHCGIADVNYFSKIFRKYTGVSPKEYRQALRAQAGAPSR